MKKIVFALLFFSFCFGSLQAQLNDYKYIIVPKKFDAFKKENQYLTSTLVRYLFEEKGFNAIYDDALPLELNNDRCLALTAQIKDESSMFATKASIILLDCQAQEIYNTHQGSSKEKEFKLSYGEAIRDAFKSFDMIAYSYSPATPKAASKPVEVSFKNDVKQIQESKVEAAENEKKEEVATKVLVADKLTENKAASESSPTEVIISDDDKQIREIKSADSEKKEEVMAEVIIAEKVTENNTSSEKVVAQETTVIPEILEEKKTIATTGTAVVEKAPETSEIWYAQQIPNGFQLVDSSPKVRLKMYKTSLNNVYIFENAKGNGLVFKKEGQWLMEYYDGSELKLEKLNIKF